jgi:hypothetical protein
VHFHLEIVAGAVHVLQQLTTEPVTVYLPAKVGTGRGGGRQLRLGRGPRAEAASFGWGEAPGTQMAGPKGT